MNIVILFFCFLNIIISSSINQNYNLNYKLNRFALKYIVFKEKKLVKILKNIKNKLEMYHNKSIVSVAKGVITYNELSEDEKTLIEAVISLCY
jgi:predicted nucleotide-binding protein (sugar kinase/HSP70/actin superfamily)